MPTGQDNLELSGMLSSNRREKSPFKQNSPFNPSRPEKVLQTPALQKPSTLISPRELMLDEEDLNEVDTPSSSKLMTPSDWMLSEQGIAVPEVPLFGEITKRADQGQLVVPASTNSQGLNVDQFRLQQQMLQRQQLFGAQNPGQGMNQTFLPQQQQQHIQQAQQAQHDEVDSGLAGPETRHSQSHNGSNDHMYSHTNSWNDRGQAAPPNHHPHGRHVEQSEAILREALQRDSQLYDTPHRSWGVPTRLEGDSGDGEQYSHYSQDGTPTGPGQGNPKRKRVFSNRIKTGCLTCRRRKKKCDEGQPQCKLIDTLSTGPMLYWCRTKTNLQATIASAEAFNARLTAREIHGQSLSTPRLPCLCSRRIGSRTS